MNQEDELFLELEYLFNNYSFNIKLERVIERGYWKLHPSEVMDVRLGRSGWKLRFNTTFHRQ